MEREEEKDIRDQAETRRIREATKGNNKWKENRKKERVMNKRKKDLKIKTNNERGEEKE